LAGLKMRTLLLDTSCFYGTNIELLTEKLPKEFLERSTILTVTEDAGPKDVLSELISNKEARAVLIDDLNSLNALMSSGDKRSSIHELFVLVRMLSYSARINNFLILATVYKSQRSDATSKRSLGAAADLQITTETESTYVTFRCDDRGIWPNGRFVANVGLLGAQDVDADIEGGQH
jgi:hypothetical protein